MELTADAPAAPVAPAQEDITWWDGETFSRVHVGEAGLTTPRCGARVPPGAARTLTTGDWLPGPRCPRCAAG